MKDKKYPFFVFRSIFIGLALNFRGGEKMSWASPTGWAGKIRGEVVMFESVLSRMHNPPHPGAVLKEYLGDLPLKEAAAGLLISRSTLQRIVTGAAKISPDMAYRLSAAFGTSSELWSGMQLRYDLYLAGKVPRRKIKRFTA